MYVTFENGQYCIWTSNKPRGEKRKRENCSSEDMAHRTPPKRICIVDRWAETVAVKTLIAKMKQLLLINDDFLAENKENLVDVESQDLNDNKNEETTGDEKNEEDKKDEDDEEDEESEEDEEDEESEEDEEYDIDDISKEYKVERRVFRCLE